MIKININHTLNFYNNIVGDLWKEWTATDDGIINMSWSDYLWKHHALVFERPHFIFENEEDSITFLLKYS